MRVRCDDLAKRCTDTDTTRIAAYAYQESHHEGALAEINFCPRYFNYRHLSSVIRSQEHNTNLREKYDLSTYDTTKGKTQSSILALIPLTSFAAHIFIHEMLHIHWVTRSGRHGPHQPVVDLWMYFKEAGSDDQQKVRVYGAKYAKILARLDSTSTLGGFIARSDESLGLYLLAKYVQKEFGTYPHRPVVNTDPNHAPEIPHRGDIFEVDDNGNVFWNTSYSVNVSQDPRQGLGNVDDTEGVTVTQLIPNAELPESYNNAWHNWALDEETPASPPPSPEETPAPPPPPPEETPIEPPGFQKIGAPRCVEGGIPGTLSIIKDQCVKLWDGYSAGGFDDNAQYQPNSPYNCENNCFAYPKGFGGIQAYGDGTYGTNCEYFSDLECKSRIGETGNVVSIKKNGIKVLDEASGQKGFSIQCYFHC